MTRQDKITLPQVIKVKQGKEGKFDYIISSLNARTIVEFSNTIRLSEDPENGVQRFLDVNRVRKIADYCKSENVLFPTPIILSLNSDFIVREENSELEIDTNEDMLEEFGLPFSIIDGQHRIEGIKLYYKENQENNKEFCLPIIIYKDADQSKAAKIFVTINANQRKVDDSTIHELFGIIYKNSDRYTVQSFSNQVTTILNETSVSPFYLSVKMLGKKQSENQFISQGTIAKKITERITSKIDEDNLRIEHYKKLKEDKSKIFRDFFIKNDPMIVAKLMINFFKAFSENFKSIWIVKQGIMTKKAVGFSALMKLLDHIYKKTDNLSYEDFNRYFKCLKDSSGDEVEELFNTSASSESVANNISKDLILLFDKSEVL